jgi:hypothetical protein
MYPLIITFKKQKKIIPIYYMDISLQSLIFFIIITIVYFIFPSIGKPQLTLADLETDASKADFYTRNMKSLGFYLGIVVITQFFLNIGYLMAKCGGALDKNIGAAALFTFIPWILIFGMMLAALIIFPGFKTAFSDVIGYFVVAGGANDIFGSILIGTDLNELINKSENEQRKTELTQAAEAIIKICGNKSILINQMNPENFLQIWNTLKPLMIDGLDPTVLAEKKTDLLNLVVLKDNIGEAFWYVYTAILISSIVYYNLATRGCVKSVEQIKSEHDSYIQQQEEAIEQAKLNNSTTYITS